MTKRIVLAGVLGGVAMFLWASLAHMVLPLGRAGIREVPDDRALLAGMRSALGESSGLYMFPALGSDADMKHYEQKLAANPSGLLIYHPPGGKAMTPSLVWLMAQTRLGFAIVVGIEIVGFLLAGLVAAKMLGRTSSRLNGDSIL
jgi:hypothetical protein